MKYPDCTIDKSNTFGEYGTCDTIWNIHGWHGDYVLLRNKDEIFKIFTSFPDSFMKDYKLDFKGKEPKILYGKWIKKKWYKTEEIFRADNIYSGKRSFERLNRVTEYITEKYRMATSSGAGSGSYPEYSAGSTPAHAKIED